jgi:ABC-type multidrug transport system ATPase subunit
MLNITSASPIVEIDHLSYWYDSSFLTLDNISFRMEQGDLLGIIGPNGAGKTTLFSCILGILTDYRGTVKLFGKEILKNRKHC